jgi:hypothetical protein
VNLDALIQDVLRREHERIEHACECLLKQGQIPVLLDHGPSRGVEVITTHEYVERYGPPTLPFRRRAG